MDDTIRPQARIKYDFETPVCCDDMAESFGAGTDNEGYHGLSSIESNMVEIGCTLPPIKYCPWCGDKIDWQWLSEASCNKDSWSSLNDALKKIETDIKNNA